MRGRGVSGLDDRRALDALRLSWGDVYDAISAGGDGAFPVWTAVSRDRGRRMLTARTPGELNAAMRADWTTWGGTR